MTTQPPPVSPGPPPQQHQPAGPGTTRPPGRKRWDTQRVLVLIVLPLMLLGIIGGGVVWFAFADWDRDGGGAGKAGDLTVVRCSGDTGGSLATADLELEITNSSGRARSYRVAFEVSSAGGTRLGTGWVFVSTLQPGQTARETGTALLTGAGRHRSFVCQVTDVD